MSSLVALAGIGNGDHGGSFSRDLRFAPPGLPPFAGEAADPIALAYAEGHAAGVTEARAEADALADAQAEARERLSFSFARLDTDLAEQLRHKLHETVVALCEATLAPLALDGAALTRRVEAAAAMFVRADDERVIRLHPDDLALVAAKLPADWQFLADPSLDRGALRVETTSGGIEDGPLQWRAAILEALRLC